MCLAQSLAHTQRLRLFLCETPAGSAVLSVEERWAVPLKSTRPSPLRPLSRRTVHLPLAEPPPSRAYRAARSSPKLMQPSLLVSNCGDTGSRIEPFLFPRPLLAADMQAPPAPSPGPPPGRRVPQLPDADHVRVSASSLGPISSTKSSKSTFPPPGGHAHRDPNHQETPAQPWPPPPLLLACAFPPH